jgi:PAS domain S-box-containing protein
MGMNTTTALPDLVSFNLKDGGLTSSYLQQLTSVPINGGADSSPNTSLNYPLPTPITFAQMGDSPTPVPQQPKQKQQSHQRKAEKKSKKLQSSRNAVAAATTNQAQQQQLQQFQQQVQQLQKPLQAPAAAQQIHQLPAAQQANLAQQQANLAQQGAFALFQQNALLAQAQQQAQLQQAQAQGNKQQPITIRPGVNTIVMPTVAQSGQEQRTDQHAAATPQFAFADPGTFLRQLQVAQLQQQFNAVQQAQAQQAQAQQALPLAQQVMTSGSQSVTVNAALQQQMQFQTQVPMVASINAAAPQAQKKLPSTKTACSRRKVASPQTKSSATNISKKAPVVSASDTDGELSSKVGSNGSVKLLSKKSNGSTKTTASVSRTVIEIDTSNMTPEEKASANRDRNREHARNTRLRKKAYLEKLKTTVDELCRERDTLVSERAGAANILVEMHNTRTEVLMSFFALRSANEKRRDLWASILDESCFTCVVPVTPYRSFPASEVQVSKCQRTILGIDGMMADTASLHVLLNSLVDRSRFPNATIVFRYTLVTEEAVIAGNQIMARWVMSTLNATQCGARMEVAKQGMLCCKFNSAHKIIGLELMFDVMALMLQLKQAAGSESFSVIPNTVQTCQRTFEKPMVMSLADEPYTIVQVNKLWEDITGYKAEEVVGKASCRVLEGEETDPNAVEVLMNEIRFKRSASAMIVNCKKTGERFRNFFLAYPLSTDSRITHYLFLSTHIDAVTGPKDNVPQAQQGMLLPPTVLSQASILQPNRQLIDTLQNLQGPVARGPSGAVPQTVQQPVFGITNSTSNSIQTTSTHGVILPPALGNTNGNDLQNFHPGALKRPHNGAGDENPSKQAKPDVITDNSG